MITLYSAPATAGMVVHWLLLELGVAHEMRELDIDDKKEQKLPAYLALNPAGVVPTLVIDGQPLTEAGAIAMHLADAYPDANLAPAPGTLARAAYYQWMVFFTNTMQPAYRAWFYATEPAGEANVDAVRASAKARLEDAFARIDAHLAAHGPYFVGEQLTAADFMATMLIRWSRKFPRPATDWPHIAAFVARMKARPTFRELYARERLTDWT